MIKLNKNQKRFFSTAVEEFGLGSIDVRLKELREFSIDQGLIIPTSALKKYCQRDDLVRGHYDLTLSGYLPVAPKPTVPLEDFELMNNPIKEMPVFVTPIPKKTVKKKKRKPRIFINSVYLLIDDEHSTISAHNSVSGAHKRATGQVLHDSGNKNLKQIIKEVKNDGSSLIKSSNSGMWCYIQEIEVED